MIGYRSIKKGSPNRQRDVMLVQDFLNREFGAGLLIDGDYGAKSEAAVKKMQAQIHTEQTGVVSKAEWLYILEDYDVLGLRNDDSVTWAYDHLNYDENNGKTFIEHITEKDIVVLHHTASGGNAYNVAEWFAQKRYGTHFTIGSDGLILQMAPLEWWGYHINMRGNYSMNITKAHEDNMAQRSIGIEICCWGALDEKDGVLLSKSEKPAIIDHGNAIFYEPKYRGYKWYQKYTDAQVYALKVLLRALRDKGYFKMDDINYEDPKWLEIDKLAVEGKRGLISHTNVALPANKTDIHPQPNLLRMLNELKQ